jgi:hypothetical protein
MADVDLDARRKAQEIVKQIGSSSSSGNGSRHVTWSASKPPLNV